jgi:hypothetical protein
MEPPVSLLFDTKALPVVSAFWLFQVGELHLRVQRLYSECFIEPVVHPLLQ